MSCIASFEEWSNIFRNRSFTLFKNDRDFWERFDSVAVSESMSSWRPLVVNVPFWAVWWASAHHKSPCSAQRYVLTFRFFFHRACRCSRGKHVRIPHAVSQDQIHHWLFLHMHLLVFFSTSLQDWYWTELADVEQTQKDDSIHHVWNFPSSTCLRVDSWCQCISFGSWGPNWLDRTTNQEQLCGSCLSCAPWQSGYDIHNFCCCHLRSWWSLFGEYCVRSWIVFYNIISEYNSTFVFWVLCLQLGILQMTDVHQWGKMNFESSLLWGTGRNLCTKL